MLQPDSDDLREAHERFDRFAFCAWKSKPEGFENAARKFERRGARKLVGDELAEVLDNFGLSWILGYKLSSEEARKILGETEGNGK